MSYTGEFPTDKRRVDKEKQVPSMSGSEVSKLN